MDSNKAGSEGGGRREGTVVVANVGRSMVRGRGLFWLRLCLLTADVRDQERTKRPGFYS